MIVPIRASSWAAARRTKSALAAVEHNADVVLFDHPLSPSQERNLEKLIERRVLDRSGLILDIFAQRARSHEGKLEVELAQLKHIASRLVRGWTHLERQRGGGIGNRGPGETQLETDRRLLGKRVKTLDRAAREDQTAARDRPAATRRDPGSVARPRRATPTPASPRCSARSPAPTLTSRTSCSRRSIRRCAASCCRATPGGGGRHRRFHPRAAA